MKPLQKFEEHIFFSTVKISISNQDGGSTSIGTGFFYESDIDENSRIILLISNRHVFQNPDNQIEISFHKRDPDDKEAVLLDQPIKLRGSEFNGVYHEHPIDGTDLACLNLSGILRQENEIYFKTLSKSLIDYQYEDVIPGQDVWFIGYPENRFDTYNNLPVLRRGYIASIPRIDFEGQPHLLIDAQVFPGSSGSPVFVSIGGKYRLLGVVTQTMIRNQKLESIPAVSVSAVQQVLGLGIVLKAHTITNMVDLVEDTVRKLKNV